MSSIIFSYKKEYIWRDYDSNVVNLRDTGLVIRRTDDNDNYLRTGTYKEGTVKTVPLQVLALRSFYGITIDSDYCLPVIRISLDNGVTWKFYKDGIWHDWNGHGDDNNEFSGNINAEFLIGDHPEFQYPTWSSSTELNEGFTSLSVGVRKITLWVKLIPLYDDMQPVMHCIKLDIVLFRDDFLDDFNRSLTEAIEDKYFFDDHIVVELDRKTQYQIPDFVPATPTEFVGKVQSYVKAYNLTDDPDKIIDVVGTWNSSGLIEFTAEQTGMIEFFFGHSPVVHFITDVVIQLSEKTTLVLTNIRMLEDLGFQTREDVDWANMKGTSYYERWADISCTMVCQSSNIERVSLMEEGLRQFIENNIVFSINTGQEWNCTQYGVVTGISRVSDELSLVDVPLRFGRYRKIGAPSESKLVNELDFDVVLTGEIRGELNET